MARWLPSQGKDTGSNPVRSTIKIWGIIMNELANAIIAFSLVGKVIVSAVAIAFVGLIIYKMWKRSQSK
mgnify:CR=1 FL=1